MNEQLARHYGPSDDAVGKLIRLERRGGRPLEVVGVARTIKHSQTVERATDFIHLPLAQHPVAMFLAIAGLYGLMAYNVTRRTREIGLRMAVGAQPAAYRPARRALRIAPTQALRCESRRHAG